MCHPWSANWMILHPQSCEPSISQISDLHNYTINSKVDINLQSPCQMSDAQEERKIKCEVSETWYIYYL